MTKEWVRELKLAVIDSDVEKIATLYPAMPDFANEKLDLNILKEIKSLISQAIVLLKDKNIENKNSLEKIKASIVYQKNMKN